MKVCSVFSSHVLRDLLQLLLFLYILLDAAAVIPVYFAAVIPV
jgi:hypothetical protein